MLAMHKSNQKSDIIHPKIYHRPYLVLNELSKQIEGVIQKELKNKTKLKILDVGCGTKPYLPFFKEKAEMYVGVDMSSALNADAVCVAENLPFANESFDVIISTQALEHVDDPKKVIEEMHRVLKREGLLILSTHGIWFKHAPQDYWRWTDIGLKKIFAPFKGVEVRSNGGSVLCFFQILNLYIAWLPIGRKPLWLISNVLGRLLDRLIYVDDYLIINYLVSAKK
jgi:ubiquinone/menaquinone biosynthesis C-methylase UbiE